MANEGAEFIRDMHQMDRRIAREDEERARRIEDDLYQRESGREPREPREPRRPPPRELRNDRYDDANSGRRGYDRDHGPPRRDREYASDPYDDYDERASPRPVKKEPYRQPTYYDKAFDQDKKTMGGSIRSMAFGKKRIKEPLLGSLFKDPKAKAEDIYDPRGPYSGRKGPPSHSPRMREEFADDGYREDRRRPARASRMLPEDEETTERYKPRVRASRMAPEEDDIHERAEPRPGRTSRMVPEEEDIHGRLEPRPGRPSRMLPEDEETAERYKPRVRASRMAPEEDDITGRREPRASAPLPSRSGTAPRSGRRADLDQEYNEYEEKPSRANPRPARSGRVALEDEYDDDYSMKPPPVARPPRYDAELEPEVRPGYPPRSGRRAHEADEYYDNYDEPDVRTHPRAPPAPGRKSRLEEPETHKLNRDDRVRRLKEAQSEHRQRREENRYEEEIGLREEELSPPVARSRGPEKSDTPFLPSRPSRPGTLASPRSRSPLHDTPSSYDRPAASIPPSVQSLSTESDQPPQFRLPERRNLVQSAQRIQSPEQEEELEEEEDLPRPVLRAKTVLTQKPVVLEKPVTQKPVIAPKPQVVQRSTTVIPREPDEVEDEAAFLSAAKSRLRSSTTHAPLSRSSPPPPPAGLSSRSPVRQPIADTDSDKFKVPPLRPTVPRKISAPKPSEASQKLAELRATKPIIKPAGEVAEAVKQKASLKPPKPVLKPKEPTAEALSAKSSLKPRSKIDRDDADAGMAALTNQLKQLKPRSVLENEENDEWDSTPRNESWDSLDSLNHPTKSRAKGPKRRLPTQ